ncbi:hypothetical protein BDW59DRAFT_166998 [Aspergillus cavernicola]|uniref:Hydroxyneurosporene synthase n=1 Tax=Aspergillus cavernicola TaxID=176166 RepID=A0ABR4HI81_9EURO
MASNLMYLTALASLASQVFSQQQIITSPHTTPDQNSVTQWISGPDAFDGPKVIPINQTTFDWWYFDTVQEPNANGESGQPSFAITFHSTGPDGFDPLTGLFPFGSPPSDNLIQINLAWPDGKTDAWVLAGGEAIFTINGDGTSANYTGTGCSFEGAPDLSEYSVYIDAPEKGIVGSLRIKSDVPPHYPCGPAEEGQDMQITPGVGWLNAIPDGYGEADFLIRGNEEFYFEGRGYHDHNYGGRRFSESCASAYWGHGRLGEWNIVWLSVLTPTGEESVSAYVTKGSEMASTEIIVAQCEGIHIRPYGANSTYPPDTTTGAPTGFRMNINTPEGLFELQAERIYVTVDFDFYRRFTGTYTGTLNGEPLPEGVALWEQFSIGE